MTNNTQHIEFKLFYKIMLLDRLLNERIIMQETREERPELQARREEIAKLIFANLTEEDKNIFLKALSSVYKILKKVT